MIMIIVYGLQLFQLREQQSKQRHSSGEEGKLTKTGSGESDTDQKDQTHPKVRFAINP